MSVRMQAVSACLPVFPEFGVVGSDHRIGTACQQGRHVERGAVGRPPAQGAAVAIDRRRACPRAGHRPDPWADEGGDLAAIEGAELGQLGDQGAQGGSRLLHRQRKRGA
jgi:hypothetical protein